MFYNRLISGPVSMIRCNLYNPVPVIENSPGKCYCVQKNDEQEHPSFRKYPRAMYQRYLTCSLLLLEKQRNILGQNYKYLCLSHLLAYPIVIDNNILIYYYNNTNNNNNTATLPSSTLLNKPQPLFGFDKHTFHTADLQIIETWVNNLNKYLTYHCTSRITMHLVISYSLKFIKILHMNTKKLKKNI